MGQKSLSALHRVDSSMTWNSSIIEKDYKWLSYNLWFIYIQFYKIIFFCNSKTNYIKVNILNNNSKNYLKSNNKIKLNKSFVRFSYVIDLYCIEFLNSVLLLNLFFKTNLRYYKNSKIKINKKGRLHKKINFFEL